MATTQRANFNVNSGGPGASEAESRWRSIAAALGPLFAHAPDAILVLDPTRQCTAANPAALALLGLTCDELQLLRIDGLVADPALVPRELARFVAHCEWRGELELRQSDGAIVAVEARAVVVPLDAIPHTVLFLRDLTERTAQDEAQSRLAALVRASPDAITSVSADGIIVDWNAAAEQLFGYSALEAIGQPVTMLAPEDRVSEVAANFARLLAGDRISGFETMRRRKDGQLIDVTLTAAPILDGMGRVVGASGNFRDITARKQAESALAAANLDIRRLLDRITDGFFALDAENRFTYLNQAAERILERPSADLLGKNIYDIFPPTLELELGLAERRQALAEGRTAIFETFYPPLDRWIEAHIYPDGAGYSIFVRDITDRKAAEGALRQSEERFRELFEQAPVMYALVRDNDGEFVVAQPNALFLATLGYAREEVVGRPWLDFYTPEAQQAFLTGDAFQRALRGRVAAQPRQMLTRNGSVLDVLLWSWPDRGPTGAGTRVAIVDITEWRRAEEALRQSEEQFRSTFTHAAIGMALVAIEGQFLKVNPALCALTGYSESELLDLAFQDVTHPDDLQEDLRRAQRLLDGEISGYQMEKRYLRKDGGIAWIRLSCTIVHDERDQPLHYIAQIEDITARKAAEAELAQERDMLRTLMDTLPDAIYVKDASSRFLRLNTTTARILGIADPDAALGKTDFDFFPEVLARQYFTDEQQVITTGEPLLNQLEAQGENEDAPWWLTSTVPLRDVFGNIVGVVGSGRDITERLHTEAALRESEARHRALLSALPDMVFRLDRSGMYLDFKADYLPDLYLSPAEFLGKTVLETLPPPVSEMTMAAISQVLQNGGINTVEYTLDVRAGRQDFEARLVAVSPDEVVAVVRNVTDRKRAEIEMRAARDAAEEASRLKSAFLSTMSHELHTPLTAITGYTELLRLAGGLTPVQEEDIAQIAQSADHLLALVGDVLDLSRLEVGVADLHVEPVALAAVVDEALAQLAPRAASRGLVLGSDVPKELVVETDRRRLRQILLNLVGNAVKFTERGGVSVEATRGDAGIEVSVRDTGIGIASNVLPHIFEEFRQAEGGVARRYEGAGLGLSIARKLAEQQGGHISVTSEPGLGSTFTLHLPASPGR